MVRDMICDAKREDRYIIRNHGKKFCMVCGNEFDDGYDGDCCGKGNFVKGVFANRVLEYVELSRKGELRGYYNRIMNFKKKSDIKMSKKRYITYLLLHKDKLVVNGDMENFISIIMKKYDSNNAGDINE